MAQLERPSSQKDQQHTWRGSPSPWPKSPIQSLSFVVERSKSPELSTKLPVTASVRSGWKGDVRIRCGRMEGIGIR